jgi:hypothetical protein
MKLSFELALGLLVGSSVDALAVPSKSLLDVSDLEAQLRLMYLCFANHRHRVPLLPAHTAPALSDARQDLKVSTNWPLGEVAVAKLR